MPRIRPREVLRRAFTPIPEWLSRRREASPGAKLLYGRLAFRAGEKEVAWPGRASLAADLGVSVSQIDRYLKELKACRLIESERLGLGRTNRYYFLDHPWIQENAKTRTQESPRATGQPSARAMVPSEKEWGRKKISRGDGSTPDEHRGPGRITEEEQRESRRRLRELITSIGRPMPGARRLASKQSNPQDGAGAGDLRPFAVQSEIAVESRVGKDDAQR
jgi:DNA-binding transcriptional ArsR family regulator